MKAFVRNYQYFAWSWLLLYFILHEYNAHFGLIQPGVVTNLFLSYAFVFLAIFLIAAYLLKSRTAASLFTFLAVLFFVFFGAMHDALKSLRPGKLLESHIFSFSLMALLLLIVFFLLKKRGGKPNRLGAFTALFAFILMIWQLGQLLMNLLFYAGHLDRAGLPRPAFVADTTASQKPDIFYIIFDSYPSSLSLDRDFGYSNKELDNFLFRNRFYVARHSKSNYPLTPFSVGSVFNLDFLDPDLSQEPGTAKLMLEGVKTVYESQLPQFLLKQGYRFENYSVFDIRNLPAFGKPYFRELSRRVIAEQTVLGRFEKNLLWNFRLRNWHTGKIEVTSALLRQRSDYVRDFVQQNLEGLEKSSRLHIDSPLFTYCHLELPHSPYYFEADGRYLPDSTMFGGGDMKEKFIKQVRYANSLIRHIVDTLLISRKRPFVIIIQGDHGFRDFTNPNDKQKIFENLNAFYFSDFDYRLLYDSISSVNTFRVVLNKYFGQRFQLLPDSAIYIRDPSFEFERSPEH